MWTQLLRPVTTLTAAGHETALLVAAGASSGDDTSVKVAIVTGIFGLAVAIVGLVGLYLTRSRGSEFAENIETHERLAVVEANIADLRADLRALMDRDRKS